MTIYDSNASDDCEQMRQVTLITIRHGTVENAIIAASGTLFTI